MGDERPRGASDDIIMMSLCRGLAATVCYIRPKYSATIQNTCSVLMTNGVEFGVAAGVWRDCAESAVRGPRHPPGGGDEEASQGLG